MFLINIYIYDTLENRISNILFLIFTQVPKLTPLFSDENVGVLTNSGINISENYFDNTTYIHLLTLSVVGTSES